MLQQGEKRSMVTAKSIDRGANAKTYKTPKKTSWGTIPKQEGETKKPNQ